MFILAPQLVFLFAVIGAGLASRAVWLAIALPLLYLTGLFTAYGLKRPISRKVEAPL